MSIVRFFYRNRAGKDTKILGWTSVISSPVVFRNQEISHLSNAFVLHADIEVLDESYQATDANGAFIYKVVEGLLVQRLQADLDKDIARKGPLIQLAEDQIEPLLQGKKKITWQMIGAYSLYRYVKGLQLAAGITDLLIGQEARDGKAMLASLEANIVLPALSIMAARDAALAQLDTED